MNAPDPITTSTKLDMPQLSGLERQVSEAPATQTAENDARTSRLMSLPAELRNRIWEYVMSVGTVYLRMYHDTSRLQAFVIKDTAGQTSNGKFLVLLKSTLGYNDVDSEYPAGAGCMPLIRCSKQIHKETKQLFFVCNQFEIQAWAPYSTLSNGLLNCGLFGKHSLDLGATCYALIEFMDLLAVAEAEAYTSVTFAIGQIDGVDVNDYRDNVICIVPKILDQMHLYSKAKPWRQFGVSMALRVLRVGQQDGNFKMLDVKMDMGDSAPGLAAAIAALEDECVNGAEWEGCDSEQIRNHAAVLREIQHAVKGGMLEREIQS
ncbi:hypothetical protein LTR17_001127 [Elasticomyces elasticus]|nr:hypothetical protein LTR17_001127 [Elasticomyces elasticus]